VRQRLTRAPLLFSVRALARPYRAIELREVCVEALRSVIYSSCHLCCGVILHLLRIERKRQSGRVQSAA
jgi:hypothetical protein